MSSHENNEKKRVQNRRPIKLADEKIGVELAERLVLKHRTNRFHNGDSNAHGFSVLKEAAAA